MITLNTTIKPGESLSIGDEVFDIYQFLTFYTNPYHCNKKFIHTVKSLNSKIFSVYANKIPGIWSGSESFKYTSREMERSIQDILDKRDNPYNRKTVYLRVIEDKDIINFFINLLFEEENVKIKDAEKKQIKKYEEEILKLKEKIKSIKSSGMINEINSKIYDREFLKIQKEKIITACDI